MIAIEMDKSQLERLSKSVRNAGKNMAKEVAAAINQVSKKTRLDMGRNIRETVVIKKTESEAPISVVSKAADGNLQALVRLKKTKRLGLREFGARQDKRGVSYKISKKGSRKRVNGGFQGPKPGAMKASWRGNAFKRLGKSRLPIVKLKAISAWGVYKKNNMTGPQLKVIEAELNKQIERRINLNILRANGLVKT